MKIQILIGSTRPGRVGPQIAQWVFKNLPKKDNTEYEIVDIAEYNLPVFDEPNHPSMSQYTKDHTKVWSQKIKEGDAYVFLTPEYNAGYPASLKNAIDYLYHEWTGKPVMIVSYGVHGGKTALEQLLQVVNRLRMKPIASNPSLTITPEMSGDDKKIKNINDSFKPYESLIKTAGEELLAINNTSDA
jgi:NAD(P)H-dependent FMN reductase